MHFNGVDASTTFTDESGMLWTAHGNVQEDTDQSVFGGASGLFDGNVDYLVANSPDLAFGTDDFTIDFRLRLNSIGSNMAIYDTRNDTYGPVGGSFVLYIAANGIINLYIPQTNYAFNTVLTTSTWYHLALVKSGGIYKLYIDGIAESTTVTNSNNNTQSRVIIGVDAGVSASLNGWIDELRISKGIARWTSNFTPPAVEY